MTETQKRQVRGYLREVFLPALVLALVFAFVVHQIDARHQEKQPDTHVYWQTGKTVTKTLIGTTITSELHLTRYKFCPAMTWRTVWHWQDRKTGTWLMPKSVDTAYVPPSPDAIMIVRFAEEGPLPLNAPGDYTVQYQIHVYETLESGRWYTQSLTRVFCRDQSPVFRYGRIFFVDVP